ncbi:IS1-like element transposase [Ornithobacterium rhinotracheale]|uniref:IS1-like element transposase n=1 Tax=Ornithobacterium rhinotracheale TaxID=28251 RepID=UPI001FF6DBD5|nr:IS1-like element transposase [Ornithobacterium rhinotracheale]MCK0202191.1 IS1-like element transposase [Ornithobacterium rhinotracheale]
MKNKTSCIRSVVKECRNCSNKTFIRYGYTKGGKRRIRCTICGKTKVEEYTYKAYNENINQSIIKFTIEGVGIRGMARILQISTNTNRIERYNLLFRTQLKD